MTIQKQDLIDFIQNFGGENITKQDILDFIANSQETKVFINYYDYTINGGSKHNWTDSDDLKDELDDFTYAKKVTVDFDPDDTSIDREQTLAVIEFFIDKDYRIEYIDTETVRFVKN